MSSLRDKLKQTGNRTAKGITSFSTVRAELVEGLVDAILRGDDVAEIKSSNSRDLYDFLMERDWPVEQKDDVCRIDLLSVGECAATQLPEDKIRKVCNELDYGEVCICADIMRGWLEEIAVNELKAILKEIDRGHFVDWTFSDNVTNSVADMIVEELKDRGFSVSRNERQVKIEW